MSPIARQIIDELDDARQRWWTFSLLCNVILVILLSLSTISIFVLADVVLQLSQIGLLALLALWCGLTVVFLLGTVFRALRRRRSLIGAARRVELSFPELGSHLTNLLQLTDDAQGADEAFRLAAVEEAAASVGQVPFQAAATRQNRLARWRLGLQTPRDLLEFSLILLLLLALIFALSAALPKWTSSTTRLFTPWRFVPQTGVVQILEVEPGDTELLIGSRLEVTAKVVIPPDVQAQGVMIVEHSDGTSERIPLLANPSRDLYAGNVPAVLRPLQYRLEIGDSQSPVYQVAVRQKPGVSEVQVRYEFPGYLDQPDEVLRQPQADLHAPQYTLAHLTLTCTTPLSRGYIQLGDRKIGGRVGEDNTTLEVRLPMNEPAGFTIHLFDDLGNTDDDPRLNSLRITPDQPPEVQLVKPPRESTATPGSELPLAIRAQDDHGLGEVRLEWRWSDEQSATQEESPADTKADSQTGASPDGEGQGFADNGQSQAAQVLQRWNSLAGAAATTLTETKRLDWAPFQAGQTVLLRAVAVDRRQITVGSTRLEPQLAVSPWHRIRLIAPQQAAAEQMDRLDSLTSQLWAILQIQLRARLQTSELIRQPETPTAAVSAATPAATLSASVRQQQVQVQTETTRLADSIQSASDEQGASMKPSLVRLSSGEMLSAVRLCELLTKSTKQAEYTERAQSLAETQDLIIDALRQLLESTRRATSAALAEMQDRPGGDLPDDVRDKMENLLERLDEFLKQQRRVIEATKDLAKKPVEDFTEEEQQLLEQLAATQDEWSRFLEDTHSDFSKLPEQDFANPSLLEELIEVQTELKMAADALTKKTADIAVPLEQLGAEMAEELATNIEKWLPDTPDRERWSQEEPLTDEMKEAPMAELPGELEDLVGELMEEEEDLFDEMEDASSSWADSLDKGAGWDAADGPISNMSAKGVTGNRLPNTSEIGGRSGEGRQGKASGEFVGDTAVGKGGRKTPSRLSPDPFVKGQVKDLSRDAVGGATGGGKESGVGGEGLEGPVPRQAQREMQRMATRQAELRNRAEGIDLKFQVMNYHHTDLKKLMQMMASVEQDLRSGRYQSALRRREVLLEGLGSVKTYLDGEFQIRRDQTSNLPAEIQKELLGGMLEASPAGWEELNRRYFERLATDAPQPGSRQPDSKQPGPLPAPAPEQGGAGRSEQGSPP